MDAKKGVRSGEKWWGSMGRITGDIVKIKNCDNYTNNLYYEDVVIALDDLEFAWTRKDVDKAIEMWTSNCKFKEIVDSFDRPGDEVFLLFLHLSRQKLIEKRKGFIWG